jgi:hypothetical protein
MRRSALIFLAVAVGAIGWLSLRKPTPPKSVQEVIEHVFDYRLTGPADVAERKYVFPASFHGVWYSEDTRVRLSPEDYSVLISRAKSDRRFSKRDVGGHIVYDRELVKARISWSADDAKTISYSYSEQ